MAGKFRVSTTIGQSDTVRINTLEKQVAELTARINTLTELVKGQAPKEKKYEELNKQELEELCAEYGLEFKGLTKAQLVQALYTRGN